MVVEVGLGQGANGEPGNDEKTPEREVDLLVAMFVVIVVIVVAAVVIVAAALVDHGGVGASGTAVFVIVSAKRHREELKHRVSNQGRHRAARQNKGESTDDGRPRQHDRGADGTEKRHKGRAEEADDQAPARRSTLCSLFPVEGHRTARAGTHIFFVFNLPEIGAMRRL